MSLDYSSWKHQVELSESQQVQQKKLMETQRQLGDGMQAKIFSAFDDAGNEICLKVFKRDQEVTEF